MTEKLSILLTLLAVAFPAVAMASSPRYVRLSYAQADASTSIGVAWTTNSESDPTIVQYGLDDAYGMEIQGTAFSAPGDLDAIHEVNITGLEPDTVYHYRVGGPGEWSADNAFLTAPGDECTPYSFIALGDDRSDNDYGPNPRWNGILMEAMEHFPLFILNSGDLVRDGSETDQWDHWLEETEPALAFAAHMPTMGNHDDGPGAGDGAYYNQVFNLPVNTVTGTEDYYFFTTGNAIVVSLSTQEFKGGDIPFGDQAAWLDQVLTENPRMWKFVFFHHPTYCSEDLFKLVHEPNEEKQNAALTPIFDKHHVDIVFYGHNHWYERLGPMLGKGGEPEGKPVDKFEDGTVYVVTGGAGAMTFNVIVNLFCPGNTKGSEVCSGDHHFVKIDIDHNKLTYTARATKTQFLGTNDANAKEIDSFTIVKAYTGADPCIQAPPVDPGPEPVPEAAPEPVPDVAEGIADDATTPDPGQGDSPSPEDPGHMDTTVAPEVPTTVPDGQGTGDSAANPDTPPDVPVVFSDVTVPSGESSKPGGGCFAAKEPVGWSPLLLFLVFGLLCTLRRAGSEVT